MLQKTRTGHPIILKEEDFGVLYSLVGYEEEDFAWSLTRALYMSSAFPTTTSSSTILAFQRLTELGQLGVEQIRSIEKGKDNKLATSILDQIDDLVEQVGKLSEDVAPAVRWFRAEKTRIGPGEIEGILQSTERLFSKLRDIGQLYSINQKLNDNLNRENLTWKS